MVMMVAARAHGEQSGDDGVSALDADSSAGLAVNCRSKTPSGSPGPYQHVTKNCWHVKCQGCASSCSPGYFRA